MRRMMLWLTTLLTVIVSSALIVLMPTPRPAYAGVAGLTTILPTQIEPYLTLRAEGQVTIEAQVNHYATEIGHLDATQTRAAKQLLGFESLKLLFGSTATAYASLGDNLTATYTVLREARSTLAPAADTAVAHLDDLRATATAAVQPNDALAEAGLYLKQIYQSEALGLLMLYPNNWRVVEKNETIIFITSLDAANFIDGAMPSGEFVMLVHRLEDGLAADVMAAALAEADAMTSRMKVKLEGAILSPLTLSNRPAALVVLEGKGESLLSLAMDFEGEFVAISLLCNPREIDVAEALLKQFGVGLVAY